MFNGDPTFEPSSNRDARRKLEGLKIEGSLLKTAIEKHGAVWGYVDSLRFLVEYRDYLIMWLQSRRG